MIDRRNVKKILSITSIAFVVLVVTGYSLSKAKNLISGPIVSITSPLQGDTLSSSTVVITGTTQNVSAIYLNDSPIFIDELGVFKEKLILPTGYTIIKLSAKDKFGRETQEFLDLIYRP
jgi:hypothetical protein